MTLREYTKEEIEAHNQNKTDEHDIWLVINGQVLALKDWMRKHPGGDEVLTSAAVAGIDATAQFVEHSHSEKAKKIAQTLAIGTLARSSTDKSAVAGAESNGHSNDSNGHSNGHGGSDDGYVIHSNPIIRFGHAFVHLFFGRSFQVHRLFGLAYLIQFIAVSYLWACRYEDGSFLRSPLIITLPLCGAMQSIIAIFTFTFLPKKQVDGGYFSGGRSGTMSYNFIKENFFFASLLAFQWLYYNDRLYPGWIATKPLWAVEAAFVFLPYVFRRQFPNLFPKTSFRVSHDTMKSKDTGKVNERERFYHVMLYITRAFYIWAKHYIGFFLNYVRFIHGVAAVTGNTGLTPFDIKYIYLIEICSAFATTISVFLHTLRFKHYLSASVSMTVYVISYMTTFIGFAAVSPLFILHWQLALIVAVGLALNMISNVVFDVYQITLMAAGYYLFRIAPGPVSFA